MRDNLTYHPRLIIRIYSAHTFHYHLYQNLTFQAAKYICKMCWVGNFMHVCANVVHLLHKHSLALANPLSAASFQSSPGLDTFPHHTEAVGRPSQMPHRPHARPRAGVPDLKKIAGDFLTIVLCLAKPPTKWSPACCCLIGWGKS